MMFLKIKTGLLTFMACLFSIVLLAQNKQEHSIAGFVCTKGTTVRVATVQVMNRRSKVITFTDDVGDFKIKAAIGDTLQFTKDEFTTLYQPVTGLPDMVIFMQKVIELKNVTVKGQTKQQELNSIMDDYRKKGVYYGGHPPVGSVILSPINALYSVFGRDAKNAKHFAEYAKNEEEAAQDSRKYNKYIVKQVTGLPDDEIQKFMDDFRPSHEELLKWNNYDVIAYIKKSMTFYDKTGARGLPKLEYDNGESKLKVDTAAKPAAVKPKGN